MIAERPAIRRPAPEASELRWNWCDAIDAGEAQAEAVPIKITPHKQWLEILFRRRAELASVLLLALRGLVSGPCVFHDRATLVLVSASPEAKTAGAGVRSAYCVTVALGFRKGGKC